MLRAEFVALLVALILLIAWVAHRIRRRGQDLELVSHPLRLGAPGPGAPGLQREHYGPPPGAVRALSHYELGEDRGWTSYPLPFEANTASAISGLIERSA